MLPPRRHTCIVNLTCTCTCYCADYNSKLALACAGRGSVKVQPPATRISFPASKLIHSPPVEAMCWFIIDISTSLCWQRNEYMSSLQIQRLTHFQGQMLHNFVQSFPRTCYVLIIHSNISTSLCWQRTGSFYICIYFFLEFSLLFTNNIKINTFFTITYQFKQPNSYSKRQSQRVVSPALQ